MTAAGHIVAVALVIQLSLLCFSCHTALLAACFPISDYATYYALLQC
jgi:hypothetical protein